MPSAIKYWRLYSWMRLTWREMSHDRGGGSKSRGGKQLVWRGLRGCRLGDELLQIARASAAEIVLGDDHVRELYCTGPYPDHRMSAAARCALPHEGGTVYRFCQLTKFICEKVDFVPLVVQGG